jgi:hypothetical protein
MEEVTEKLMKKIIGTVNQKRTRSTQEISKHHKKRT